MMQDDPSDGIVIEIEQQCLGGLLAGAGVNSVRSFLREGHFLEDAHKLIYRAILKAQDAYGAISPAIVSQLVENNVDEALKARAGLSLDEYFLRMIADTIYGGSKIEAGAQAVVDQWARIRLKEEFEIAAQAAGVRGASADAIMRSVASSLETIRLHLARRSGRRSRMTIGQAGKSAIDAAVEAREAGGGLTGVSWGFADVDRLTGGMQRKDLILVGARPSMGKAQPLTAKVKTLTGWKPMGEIRIGDELASEDGRRSLVSGVFPQGPLQIYRVTFSDGRSTRVCGQHLWAVESSRFEGRKVWSTDEIARRIATERYANRLHVPLPSGEFGTSDSLPVPPWLLGVLIGNGNLTRSTPVLSTADAATLFRVQTLTAGRQELKAAGDYDYRIIGASGVNELAAALGVLGLRGKRSEDKFIPAAYLDADRADRLALLQGLLDTDGWVETFGSVRYSTSSRQLAADVQYLVRSLGGLCSVSTKTPKFTHRGEARHGQIHYTCNIRHSEPETLLTLKRKTRRCTRTKPVLLSVKCVEPDGYEEAQCISVTHPSRLYLTDDFVVTHNTSLMTSSALVAARKGNGVGILSLEMDAEKLTARAISDLSLGTHRPIEYVNLIRGSISDEEIAHARAMNERLAQLPIEIDESAVTTFDIRAKIEGMLERFERARWPRLSVLMIDHLGFVSPGDHYRGNRNNEIGEITRGLKDFAKEYGIAVVLLSQLSRDVTKRDNKRPQLSDLRDSGNIEQDADVVVFLHREAYYLERTTASDTEEELQRLDKLDDCQNKLEFIIAKQRNGPVTTVDLWCDMAFSAVRNGERYARG